MARKRATSALADNDPEPEQKGPFELASTIAQRVQILDVRLLESRTRQAFDAAPEQKPEVVNRVKSVAFRIEADLIFVEACFELRLLDLSTQAKPRKSRTPKVSSREPSALVEIDCTMLLVYRIVSPAAEESQALQAFAEINGIYNAYPYWREFAQNSAARMGIPGLVVPVFRLD